MATTNGFVLNGTTSITTGIGIAKSFNTATTYSHPISTCRLYCKMIEMAPQAEEFKHL